MLDHGMVFVDERPDVSFVGMADFVDKSLSLEESVENGIRFVDSLDAPVFLFDGHDSTSLLGTYEVFANTGAWYLFKQALLPAAAYKTPSAFNKWFFGSGSGLDAGYDIPDGLYDRLKLSGWNFGVLRDGLLRDRGGIHELNVRHIDVAAVFGVVFGGRTYNADHGVRNDTLYAEHRMRAWTTLQQGRRRWNMVRGTLSPAVTQAVLRCSRIAISPFGMGEVCCRDFEAIAEGCVLVKPAMDSIKTIPDVFVDGETYCSVRVDFADLIGTLETVLQWSEERRREMVLAFRARYAATFSPDMFARYWADLLARAEAR